MIHDKVYDITPFLDEVIIENKTNNLINKQLVFYLLIIINIKHFDYTPC